MIEIKGIGTFESVHPILKDVLDENISMLEEHLKQGWVIDNKIPIGKYTEVSPLDCALIMERSQSVKWLVEHGADLNEENSPSFLNAVRYCREPIIRYLVSQGAEVNVENSVDSDAFQCALMEKRYENLPVIHKLGHRVNKYGGKAFRTAVFYRDYSALDFFINHGVDINYSRGDDIFPFKPTPLCVAARYTDLDMCKYLIEHGADVTITEKGGMRPYSIALEKGDVEMAEYFKSLEPEAYHNLHNKLDELRTYKLPKALSDLLQGEGLHFELSDCDFGFIDFLPLEDTIPMKVGRQKLLRISKTTGDYNDIHIVWNPKTKKIAFYDEEHEEFHDITDFKEFIENMTTYMQKITEGEY